MSVRNENFKHTLAEAKDSSGKIMNVGDLAVRSSVDDGVERLFLVRVTEIHNQRNVVISYLTVNEYMKTKSDVVGNKFSILPARLTLIPSSYAINSFPDEWLTEMFNYETITDMRQLGLH